MGHGTIWKAAAAAGDAAAAKVMRAAAYFCAADGMAWVPRSAKSRTQQGGYPRATPERTVASYTCRWAGVKVSGAAVGGGLAWGL